jgi:hypothetical protein
MAHPQTEDSYDTLVPDPQVWEEFGITSMTLDRWTKDKKLGFPPPAKVRGRNFRSRRQLERFKARLFEAAINDRNAT